MLSVLSKKRGEKGYRELQGESMRSLLLDIIRKEVSAGKVKRGINTFS